MSIVPHPTTCSLRGLIHTPSHIKCQLVGFSQFRENTYFAFNYLSLYFANVCLSFRWNNGPILGPVRRDNDHSRVDKHSHVDEHFEH